MIAPAASPRPLRRDQERALEAYRWAARDARLLGEYEIAVQTLVASLLRSGLAVAVSVLERDADRASHRQLLHDLSTYALPGLPAGADWPARVRGLPDMTSYMQATRELLALLAWLKRACRAVQHQE